jgi:hypothetical protein
MCRSHPWWQCEKRINHLTERISPSLTVLRNFVPERQAEDTGKEEYTLSSHLCRNTRFPCCEYGPTRSMGTESVLQHGGDPPLLDKHPERGGTGNAVVDVSPKITC